MKKRNYLIVTITAATAAIAAIVLLIAGVFVFRNCQKQNEVQEIESVKVASRTVPTINDS